VNGRTTRFLSERPDPRGATQLSGRQIECAPKHLTPKFQKLFENSGHVKPLLTTEAIRFDANLLQIVFSAFWCRWYSGEFPAGSSMSPPTQKPNRRPVFTSSRPSLTRFWWKCERSDKFMMTRGGWPCCEPRAWMHGVNYGNWPALIGSFRMLSGLFTALNLATAYWQHFQQLGRLFWIFNWHCLRSGCL